MASISNATKKFWQRRGLEVVGQSCWGEVVVRDPDAPQVPWITREKLQQWVWAMPLSDVSAALRAPAHILCDIFRIERPGARHWTLLRTGAPVNVPRVSDAFPATMPVPLALFAGAGARDALRVPDPAPWCQVGGPDLDRPAYLRSLGDALPAILSAGSPAKSFRLRAFGRIGPPAALTRKSLSELIWRMAPLQIDEALGLYGISKRVVLLLAREAGIRVPSDQWLLSSKEWVRQRSYDRFVSERRGRSTEAPINMSPDHMAELGYVAAREEAEQVRTEKERFEAVKAAKAAARTKSLDRGCSLLAEIIDAAKRGRDVSVAWGKVGRQPVKLALKEVLTQLLGEREHKAVADLASRVLRNCALPADIILVEQAYGGRELGLLLHGSVSTARYSDEVRSGDRACGLAEWLTAASAVEEAQTAVAEALERCRSFASSPSRGLIDPSLLRNAKAKARAEPARRDGRI